MVIIGKCFEEFSDYNLPPIISINIFFQFLHARICPFILKNALPQYFEIINIT